MPDRKLRILLIDDDEDTFILARGLLLQSAAYQYELDWTPVPENGRELIRQGQYDAYLIDYRLGAVDGLTLVREAVAEGCRAPLILLTGQDDRETDLLAMEAGAADYLVKGSLDAAGLERSIRYALERGRREQVEVSLRDSEALYHSLVQSLPVCVLRKDLSGHFIFANQAYCEFTGHRIEDILGRTDFDLSPPEIARKFREDDQRVVESGQQLRNIEVNETDGRLTWVEVIKTPVRNSRGKIVGTQAIFWDVSERQMAVHALRKAKEAAEAASRAKSEFLANMSHEIRTPLNAVIGMTELVLDTPLNQTQREYLNLVLSSGESLLAVINDILDFSKIEAGKLDLERRVFDLREVCGDTMKSLALRARGQSLELACHVSPDVPAKIWGDPNRLRQVLVNLVGNAIKFTDHGEVVLDVRVESKTEQFVRLHFEVSDTGIGIQEDKLATIFEAFEQVDSGSTRRFGGTGLGLTICSRLVGLMGGKFWVESVVGKGSQFHFTVRFEIAQQDLPEIPRDAAVRLQGTRVMVVDDHATNRLIYQEMLTNWELCPTCVGDAQEALALMTAAARSGNPFQLLISDVEMPQLDGFGLVERMRENTQLSETIVIMSSSADRPTDPARCRDLGIAACLIKPVKQSEFFDALVSSLGITAPEDSESSDDELPTCSVRPLRILLAEDNKVNQKLAVGLLEKWGHQVTITENGSDTVQKWLENDFDLIIMDVQMPVMDGLEATETIRKHEATRGGHIPIIAMTAHAMSGDREECLETGMDEYVAKPLRMRELYAAISKFFATPSANESSDGPGDSRTEETAEHHHAEQLDWDAALSTCAGDRSLMIDVMSAFVDEMPKLIRQLENSLQQDDFPTARRMAHTIKGSLRPFGETSAGALAMQIESAAQREDRPAIIAVLPDLKRQLEAILDEVGAVVKK